MKTDKEIYHELAQDTIDRIEEEWTQIKMVICYIPEGTTECSVWISHEETSKPIMIVHNPRQFASWLSNLYDFTKVNNFTPWNQFTFLINESGKFSIEYEWNGDLAEDVILAHKETEMEVSV